MVRLCDRCRIHKINLREVIILKKHFELCTSCLNEVILFIEGKNKKKNGGNFLDRFKDNLESMNK